MCTFRWCGRAVSYTHLDVYKRQGVLPAGQEAAEKALEKGCEVYRLYSDNTEGLCCLLYTSKELYDKKTELENLEIINTVRSMVMDKDQIMAYLSSMKGGTKPAENTEVIDNA